MKPCGVPTANMAENLRGTLEAEPAMAFREEQFCLGYHLGMSGFSFSSFFFELCNYCLRYKILLAACAMAYKKPPTSPGKTPSI